LKAAADQVDAEWRKLRARQALPGLHVMDGYLAAQAYRFTPLRRSSAKSRLVAWLPGHPIKLLLGSAPEIDAQGKPVLLHELEAEPATKLSDAQAQKAAKAIG